MTEGRSSIIHSGAHIFSRTALHFLQGFTYGLWETGPWLGFKHGGMDPSSYNWIGMGESRSVGIVVVICNKDGGMDPSNYNWIGMGETR